MAEKGFEEKKNDFFKRLSVEMHEPLKLHENPGRLWEKDENKKDWRNVTDHCLMEAARARVLADWLGLTAETKKNLTEAATLHDFYKKQEVKEIEEDIKKGGSGRNGVLKIKREINFCLKNAGFNDSVILFAESAGGQPEELFRICEILSKKDLSEIDLGQLIINYIDNYTRGSEWVSETGESNGIVINDIDRRNTQNALNPVYAKMNQESLLIHKGHALLDGKNTFEAMVLVGHLSEFTLAQLIRNRSGCEIKPIDLPEEIDKELKKIISKPKNI